MLFEKEKYYKLIKDLEKIITVIYICTLIFAVLIGIFTGGTTLIITIPIGLLAAFLNTIILKIKVQEMKWKIDMYDKINKL